MQAEKLEHDTGSRDSKGDAHKLVLNFEMRVGIYHQKDDEDEPSATQEKPGSALRQLNDSRRYAVFCLDHSWAPRSFTARNSLPAIGDSEKNCRRSPFHLTNMAVAVVDDQAELQVKLAGRWDVTKGRKAATVAGQIERTINMALAFDA